LVIALNVTIYLQRLNPRKTLKALYIKALGLSAFDEDWESLKIALILHKEVALIKA
jgi:hypothetical protein